MKYLIKIYFVIVCAYIPLYKSYSSNPSNAGVTVEYRGSFNGGKLWIIRYNDKLLGITCGESELYAIRVPAMFPLSVSVDQLKREGPEVIIYLAKGIDLTCILQIKGGRVEVVSGNFEETLRRQWEEDTKLMKKPE